MKLSLRTALILAILVGLLLPATIASYLRLDSQLGKARLQSQRDHARLADILMLGMQEPLWNLSPESGRPLLDSVMSDERVVRVLVSDNALGTFLAANRPERRQGQRYTLTRMVSKQGTQIGKVTVEFDDGRVIAQIRGEQRQTIVSVLVQLAVSLGLILFLLDSRVVKPLAALSRQSRKLAEQELDEPFIWKREDELGQLGHSLEATRQSLKSLIDTLEQKNLQLEADLISRRHIESALRASQDRFQRLVESTRVIPWDANPEEWRFIYVGPRAEALLGHPLAVWYHENFLSTYLHPDDRHLAYQLFTTAHAGTPVEFECRLLARDERTVWVHLLAEHRRDEDGHHLQGFLIDITARKTAEIELEHYRGHLEEGIEQRTRALAAANHELEAFAQSVAHDLRSPLRTIEGYIEVLLDDYGERLDGRARSYVTRMRGTMRHMGALIDDLLTLSRLSRSEVRRQPVDLAELARGIGEELQALHPERTVRLTLPGRLVVSADPKLIRIMLYNLFDNAWKFTARNPDPAIEFGITEANGQQVFHLQDNGVGFDMAQVMRLFLPFQRLHPPGEFDGNGIGLAIAQALVRLHGGRIWAKGVPGQGAAFFFTLPEGRLR
ncbi:ATP-binding protein [Chitiniphilus purpureus]|uniref:histidine kinase n=1 Tax=Chitiniphilus purpureus TaxID=2981137 RepID=A0ABY6DIJ2_9NEIS|nr:ATP-binding protein [Chitiniphilus sp. CD1]UXY14142.1 ATP-binding protein [Chitiniphilus sp. CD1]